MLYFGAGAFGNNKCAQVQITCRFVLKFVHQGCYLGHLDARTAIEGLTDLERLQARLNVHAQVLGLEDVELLFLDGPDVGQGHVAPPHASFGPHHAAATPTWSVVNASAGEPETRPTDAMLKDRGSVAAFGCDQRLFVQPQRKRDVLRQLASHRDADKVAHLDRQCAHLALPIG